MKDLSKLHSSYAPHGRKRLKELYDLSIKKRKAGIDLALKSGLAGLLVSSGDYIKDVASVSSEAKEAFSLAFPNMKLADLAGKSVEYMDGIEQGWKGKLFEVIVAQKLNAGDTVGGITLGKGEVAQLAENPTQAQWDLQILDNNGVPVDYLQLKATDNQAYITETLEKYPTTEILTTSEIDSGDMVMNTDIADLGLEEAIGDTAAVYSEGIGLLGADFGLGFGTFFIGSVTYGWIQNKTSIGGVIQEQNQRMQKLLKASTRHLALPPHVGAF